MPARRTERLRSGFTTGACAAAAAKAATLRLFGRDPAPTVTIPFPGGERYAFTVHSLELSGGSCRAGIIKDAGDDPDVTNGAEISATVIVRPAPQQAAAIEILAPEYHGIRLFGGTGVGQVTKPGLPVPVGEPAINPVPQHMIREATAEATLECGYTGGLDITIAVRDGELLAEKTLNRRLGIIGGLSILGTTGIVRPVSAKAWTDTIEISMSVARAAGLTEVILSTGRTSEAAIQRTLHLPEEAQVMMGDYLRFSLEAAARHGFSHIHLAGMWGKLIKAALEIPQTHVRHGALAMEQAAALLRELGLPEAETARCAGANTSREVYQLLRASGRQELITGVCLRARDYARRCAGLPVSVYLVTSEEGLVLHV